MKPKLISSAPHLQSTNQSTVSDMVEAWQALERLLEVYTSGQFSGSDTEKNISGMIDGEAELDRITDQQLSLISKVVQTASRSESDVRAKLELWKDVVNPGGENEWLQASDKLILSVISDFEKMNRSNDRKTKSTA